MEQTVEHRYQMMVTDNDLAAIARSRWWEKNVTRKMSTVIFLAGACLIAVMIFAPLIAGVVACAALIVGAIYISWRASRSQRKLYNELKKELS